MVFSFCLEKTNLGTFENTTNLSKDARPFGRIIGARDELEGIDELTEDAGGGVDEDGEDGLANGLLLRLGDDDVPERVGVFLVLLLLELLYGEGLGFLALLQRIRGVEPGLPDDSSQLDGSLMLEVLGDLWVS